MMPFLIILAEVLREAGFDPGQLVGLGVREGWNLLISFVRNLWLQKVPKIVKEMDDQGWKLTDTSVERPNAPGEYVGKIAFKLMHETVPPPFRDAIRDIEDADLVALVAGRLDPTDTAHNVRAVIEAQVALIPKF